MNIAVIFESLYAAEWSKAVRTASRAYNGADGGALAAQAFANLWAARERLDWSRPGALFGTTLRNVIIDARRAHHETVSIYGDNGLMIDAAAPMSNDSAAGRLANVLDVLTDDQRAVLMMRGEDLKFGEIAARLNITEDAAKKLAKRGRARLERAAAAA